MCTFSLSHIHSNYTHTVEYSAESGAEDSADLSHQQALSTSGSAPVQKGLITQNPILCNKISSHNTHESDMTF